MDDRNVALRAASQDDAEALAALFLRSRTEAMPWLVSPHEDAEAMPWMRDTVLGSVHGVSKQVWVAHAADRALGFAVLADGWLEHLYVDPPAQGSGVGRLLLDAAKDASPAGLQLYVFERNERARRFYENAGCTLTARSDGSRNEEHEPDCVYAWPGRTT